MRTILPATLLIAACDLPPPSGGSGTSSTEACAYGEGWEPASSAGMTILNFAVDNLTWAAAYDEDLVDDTYGPSACYDTENDGTASWVISLDGEAWARIDMYAVASEGAVDLTDPTEGLLAIEVFGHDSPVIFEGEDFTTGTWTVDSLSPSYEMTVQGSAQFSGRFLDINLTAEMTP